MSIYGLDPGRNGSRRCRPPSSRPGLAASWRYRPSSSVAGGFQLVITRPDLHEFCIGPGRGHGCLHGHQRYHTVAFQHLPNSHATVSSPSPSPITRLKSVCAARALVSCQNGPDVSGPATAVELGARIQFTRAADFIRQPARLFLECIGMGL